MKNVGLNLNSYAANVEIENGGIDYVINDEITLAGGAFTSPIILKVIAVNLGIITEVSISNKGIYLEPLPKNPLAQIKNSGKGKNASFNITSWLAYVSSFGLNIEGHVGDSLARPNIPLTI